MQRGFKARCEQIARRCRRNLGVSLDAPLPFARLADRLGVVIWTPADVPGLDAMTVQQLSVNDAGAWSAVTVALDGRRIVVVNSAQDARRIPSNIVHELAHVMLGHAASRADISEDGHLWLSTHGQDQEDEADWLAAALLLPREGLLQCFARHRDAGRVSDHFKVSVALVRWRLNATGVARQVNGRA